MPLALLKEDYFAFAHWFPQSFGLPFLFLESIDSFQFSSFKEFHSFHYHFILGFIEFHSLFLRLCSLDYVSLLLTHLLSKSRNPYHLFVHGKVSLNSPFLFHIMMPFNQAVQLTVLNLQLLKDKYCWSIDSYQRNLSRFWFNYRFNSWSCFY